MKALTPSTSRFLAIALLIITLLLLILFIVKPVAMHFIEAREEINRLEHEIAVYQRVAGNLTEDQARLNEARNNNPVRDLYFQEEGSALASAALQQHLNRVVSRSGGQVVSTQILQKAKNTPLPPISISIHLRCEVSELVALLHALESGQPLLFIDNLTIASTNTRATSNRANSRVRRNTTRQRTPVAALDVRFELTGYSAKEES